MVQSLVINFNEPVTFSTSAAAAITLQRTSNTGPTDFVDLVFAPATGSASSFTITFDDATLATPVGNAKSLIDGRYSLTLDATQIHSATTGLALDGNADGTPGDNASSTVIRLYGDSNGDGTIDQTIDFVAFRNAFGLPSNAFSFDANGPVDQSDFVEFRNRFGLSV